MRISVVRYKLRSFFVDYLRRHDYFPAALGALEGAADELERGPQSARAERACKGNTRIHKILPFDTMSQAGGIGTFRLAQSAGSPQIVPCCPSAHQAG